MFFGFRKARLEGRNFVNCMWLGSESGAVSRSELRGLTDSWSLGLQDYWEPVAFDSLTATQIKISQGLFSFKHKVQDFGVWQLPPLRCIQVCLCVRVDTWVTYRRLCVGIHVDEILGLLTVIDLTEANPLLCDRCHHLLHALLSPHGLGKSAKLEPRLSQYPAGSCNGNPQHSCEGVVQDSRPGSPA